MNTTRRWVLSLMGRGAVGLAFLTQIGAAARALLPNVLYEPLKRFKLKRPDQYAEGFTFDPDRRLFVVRNQDNFHVISAVCTHLGCTVQWRATEFDCPCHGSRFRPDGSVIGGPAPRPLAWYDVSLSPDGFIEVDTETPVVRGFNFTLPKAKA
ncbi:MAG: Rieske 2Fe-2S domain-containing protein [Candidatus Binataceae bacterium]